MDKELDWDKGRQKGHGGGDDEGLWTTFQRETGQEFKDKLVRERQTATNNRFRIL